MNMLRCSHMEGIHVSIKAEELTRWLDVPITNTLLTSWLVGAFLIVFSLFVRRHVSLVPGKFQIVMETMFGGVQAFVAESLESVILAKRFTPFLITIFLFILIGNWMEFIPGVESIVFHTQDGEVVPFLRAINTDLNIPLALAIIAFITIETTGIMV